MIALKYGFADYRTIWDHPENASLKQKRQNPNILFPGDRLFIPDKKEKEESGSTEQHHRFVRKAQKLMLRIVARDLSDDPIANAPCELIVDTRSFKLTTDGNGKIEQEIDKDAQRGQLTIKDPKGATDIIIEFKIGHLDPVEEVTGQQARLNNLGYNAGEVGRADPYQFRSAVEEFQCDHKLKVDGDCGPQTQAKLKEVHGC